jgi:hypothetical protein
VQKEYAAPSSEQRRVAFWACVLMVNDAFDGFDIGGVRPRLMLTLGPAWVAGV